MLRNRLEPDDVGQVIRRAQELSSLSDEDLLEDEGSRAAVSAMEETGISRSAALQALRERLLDTAKAAEVAPGQVIWAGTGDGWYCPAKVESLTGSGAKVTFMNGASGVIADEDIKQFAPHPGFKVHGLHSGMWWEQEVVGYNPHAQTVTLNNYGSQVTLGLDSIKLKDKRNTPPLENQLYFYGERLLWALGGGGVVFLLMKILIR